MTLLMMFLLHISVQLSGNAAIYSVYCTVSNQLHLSVQLSGNAAIYSVYCTVSNQLHLSVQLVLSSR